MATCCDVPNAELVSRLRLSNASSSFKARLFGKDVELTQLRADVLRLEKEKLEIQKELEVEIELRKEIGARLNLKCADLAAARDELEEVRK